MFKQRHLWLSLVVTFCLILSVLILSTDSVFATGTTCKSLNGQTDNASSGMVMDGNYEAGDTLVYSFVPHLGPTSQIQLYVNGLIVDSSTSPGSVSYKFPKNGSYSVSVTFTAGMVNATISCTGLDDEGVAGPPATNLFDGRLNNSQSHDVAAPIVVYCSDGNVDVYKINPETGDGTRVISVPQVEGTPESTQMLGSAEGVSLYWLNTGEYQINTANFEGVPYVITWIACSSADLNHLNS